MALTSGTLIGPYEIVAPLGEGGMGEVYRARDTRLGREVALKVLRSELLAKPDQQARFEREAILLASLNHPGIATLYGLEEHRDARVLVMELVPGKSLAEWLAGGPLALQEVLVFGQQIAEALEIAHLKGIVHRDLKPENIKITPEGKIKILDFGIAKMVAPEPASTDEVQPASSFNLDITTEQLIIGTPSYMSPEQARGRPVDKRTDIWAFGCILYEALAGKVAFEGETNTDTLAAVIRREPDWSALPGTTPPKVVDLVQRCLRKELSRRLRDIGDAHLELEEVAYAAARGTQEFSTTQTALKTPAPSDPALALPSFATMPTPLATSPHPAPSAVSDAAPTTQPREDPPPPKSWIGLALGSLMIAIAVLVAGWIVYKPTPPPGPVRPSVAVLPFETYLRDAELQRLAESLTTGITNKLSQIPDLRVASQGQVSLHVAYYAQWGPQMSGRNLGVRAVLAGKILKENTTLVIKWELVDVETGRLLSGDEYRHETADLSGLVDTISQKLSRQVHAQLTGQRPESDAGKATGPATSRPTE